MVQDVCSHLVQIHDKCFNACVVPALATCTVWCFSRGLGLNKMFFLFSQRSSASFYWCPLRTIDLLFLHWVASFLVTFSKFQTFFHMRLGNLKFQELGKIKLALAEVKNSRWGNALIDIFLQRGNLLVFYSFVTNSFQPIP